MKVEVFIDKLDQVYAGLPQKMLDNLDIAALDTKATIQLRIQTTGMDSDGKPLRPYTKKYQKYKEKKGKYTGVVDFTLTTDMWSSISITESRIIEPVLIVRIGGIDSANVEKMKGLAYGNGKTSKGRGDFLQPNKEEEANLLNDFAVRYADDIKDLLK